jgi:hypothetical protein
MQYIFNANSQFIFDAKSKNLQLAFQLLAKTQRADCRNDLLVDQRCPSLLVLSVSTKEFSRIMGANTG